MLKTAERAAAHAAERWARAVRAVLDSPQDPRTIDAWSRIAGAASSTLRAWCVAAHCKPKASLDLARVVRAIHIAAVEGEWDPENLLDVTDGRTLSRLLLTAGVPPLATHGAVSVADVLASHRFAVHPKATQELASLLDKELARRAPPVVGAGRSMDDR